MDTAALHHFLHDRRHRNCLCVCSTLLGVGMILLVVTIWVAIATLFNDQQEAPTVMNISIV